MNSFIGICLLRQILFCFADTLVFRLLCAHQRLFCREGRCVNNYEFNVLKMEKIYESPRMEVVAIDIEQSMLCASLAGEGINEWEDM